MTCHQIALSSPGTALLTACCARPVDSLTADTFTFAADVDCPAAQNPHALAVRLVEQITDHARRHEGGTGLADTTRMLRTARRLRDRLAADMADQALTPPPVTTDPPLTDDQLLAHAWAVRDATRSDTGPVSGNALRVANELERRLRGPQQPAQPREATVARQPRTTVDDRPTAIGGVHGRTRNTPTVIPAERTEHDKASCDCPECPQVLDGDTAAANGTDDGRTFCSAVCASHADTGWAWVQHNVDEATADTAPAAVDHPAVDDPGQDP